MSKMAAKSKKRVSKFENKLLKLDKLEINDVICSVCLSVLVEPVTLPCHHDFCQSCFNGSIENSLNCPLCRARMGAWLRSATKQKNLVNLQLWKYIKNKFSREVDKKINEDDVNIPREIPIPRLSAPGEIRKEYEAELKRLRSERLKLGQKHLAETELLIKKLQAEDLEAEQTYIEQIYQDEMLAKQIQHAVEDATVTEIHHRQCSKDVPKRTRFKARKIDSYASKLQAPVNNYRSSKVMKMKKQVPVMPSLEILVERLPQAVLDSAIAGTYRVPEENPVQEKKKLIKSPPKLKSMPILQVRLKHLPSSLMTSLSAQKKTYAKQEKKESRQTDENKE